MIRIFVASLAMAPAAAFATIVSVSGPESNLGGLAEIIAAPADVREDASYNIAQQGFDEIQGYSLLADLAVDGGLILAGTTVNSHMIFLNSGPGDDNTKAYHFGVEWVFDSEILGVMSKRNGEYEIYTSDFLGAPGTIYPDTTFILRGMEGNYWDDAGCTTDCYNVDGNSLNLSMWVSEPGDWIRVVTLADAVVTDPTEVPVPTVSVPTPGSLLLLGLGLVPMGLRRRSAA